MASICSRTLVNAALRVERMSLEERERLADEVHARQPNLVLLCACLARYGATLVQIEVVLNLLLVLMARRRFNRPAMTAVRQRRRKSGRPVPTRC